MERRRFLAAVGVSFTLAGCLSRGSGPGRTETPDPTATPPSDGFALGETTDDANPHELRVTNDGDGTRTIDLRITDSGGGETLLDRSFSLGADGEISGELRGPATYEVRVAVSGTEAEHVTTVEYFDTCNTYRTTVTIDPDGSMTSQMFRTDARCPIPPTETPPPGTPPLERFELGETTGDVNPHGLSVRNDGENTRTVELQVTDADTEETLLDRSYTLGAGAVVSGTLRGPATYEVRVAVPEAETEHHRTVDHFDTCNEYGTTATVNADGSITSRMVSTAVACDPDETPPPGTPPLERFELGETTGDVNPHELTVRNDGEDSRAGRLQVTDADTDETLLDRAFSLEAGKAIGGELRGPATYEVRVAIPETGSEAITTVEYFDTCNDYGTTVTIAPDASLSTEMLKTDAYCGTDPEG
jgi:hypothetical protein